jgi:predicted nucleotidyltransferase
MRTTLDPTLKDLADRLRAMFQKYGVCKAIVFGSRARGEASRRSDLDLIVIQETDKRFLDRYDGLLGDLIDAAACSVDLLIYTPSEYSEMRERPFVGRAEREGVVIYESERQSISG